MAQLTGHLARSGFAVLSIDQFGKTRVERDSTKQDRTGDNV